MSRKKPTPEEATAGLREVLRKRLARVLAHEVEPGLFASSETVVWEGGALVSRDVPGAEKGEKGIALAKAAVTANLDALAEWLAAHIATCARTFCKPELLVAVLKRHDLLERWPIYAQAAISPPPGWNTLRDLLGAITSGLPEHFPEEADPATVIGVLPEEVSPLAMYSKIGWCVLQSDASGAGRFRRVTPGGLAEKGIEIGLITQTWQGEASPLAVARWAREKGDALASYGFTLRRVRERPIERGGLWNKESELKREDLLILSLKEEEEVVEQSALYYDVVQKREGVRPGEAFEVLAKRGHGFYLAMQWREGELEHYLPGEGLALLYYAEQAVLKDAERPAIAWDTSSPHYDFTSGVARMDRGDMVRFPEKAGRISLLMPNGKSGIQLTLPGTDSLGQAVAKELARDVKHFRKGHGLRYWIAFQHQLSTTGGRRGFVRWTVDGCLDALGYSKKRRQDDPKLREEAARAMKLLTQIELVHEDGKKRDSLPLVLVAGRRERFNGEAWELDGLVLHVNPLLYEGVRTEGGRLGSNWYPAPVALAGLNPKNDLHAMILGAACLPFLFRYDGGKGKDSVRLSGAKLLEQADISHALLRNTPGRAWDTAEAALRRLQEIGSIGSWAWDAGAARTLAGCVTIWAAAWASDRLLHGVEAVEKPPAAVLLTGAELLSWREKRGLTQAQAAEVLGVGVATVKRAEWAPEKRLGRVLQTALSRSR